MEVDKSFVNILVSPQYNVYKEVIVTINKKQYPVKIHLENVKSYISAQNKIRYRLVEHIHTTPPKKRGRNKIYPDGNARRQAYIERRRARIAQARLAQAVA